MDPVLPAELEARPLPNRVLLWLATAAVFPSGLIVPVTGRADGPWGTVWIWTAALSALIYAPPFLTPTRWRNWTGRRVFLRSAVAGIGLALAVYLLWVSVGIALLWGADNPVCGEVSGTPPSCQSWAYYMRWLLVVPGPLAALWAWRSRLRTGIVVSLLIAVAVTVIQILMQWFMLGQA